MAAQLTTVGTVGAQQAKQIGSFGERIARLLQERAELNESISEVFNEAGEAGFDKKVLRKAVKRAMADPASLQAEEEAVETYVEALRGLPLFAAADAREAA
jgi:uncharacterized protein (UPF0335 family)